MITAPHSYQPNGLGAIDENGNVPCAVCGRPEGVHPQTSR